MYDGDLAKIELGALSKRIGGVMAQEDVKPICGIVMPISAIDGCTESHWAEVQSILVEAIQDAGFEGNLVSNADDVGIIHKRIIQNLYDNPVVVCDVSGKNPNVMFELGLRLAFDKPTIIIKDDKTAYSFDTSSIEHLEYPRDLRFSSIIAFKQKLTDKIKATHLRATTDPEYTTFLKHFGEFKVAKLDQKEVSGQEFIFDELKSILRAIQHLEKYPSTPRNYYASAKMNEIDAAKPDMAFVFAPTESFSVNEFLSFVGNVPEVDAAEVDTIGSHKVVNIKIAPSADVAAVKAKINAWVKK
jgi:hypothetical protein